METVPTQKVARLLPQYRRIREIGRGKYGVVMLAQYLGEYYALKTVTRPGDAEEATDYARELRGVRTIRRLPQIKGLIRIHDFAEAANGREFAYVMDLADPELDGVGPDDDAYRPRTLASVIAAEVALPLAECVEIGISLATALAELQRRHVIHRDVKPANIVFVRDKAVLADVGLAADVRETSSIVGTPGYAPPERQGSPAGDVFGLGKTLYRISTGRQPSEEGLPPCIEADVDAPFFWKWMLILSKATARDPNKRYRSAKGFLRDLRRLRVTISATQRRIRRALAIVGLILVVAVIVPALWHQPLFYAWLTNTPQMRDRISLPYPYSLVKPLLMRKWRSQLAAEEQQLQIEREQKEHAQRLRKEQEKQRQIEIEERRKAEVKRRTEERQKAEERRRALDESRRLEEDQRKAEEQRLRAERQEEERRQAQERRLAEERQAEERRKADEESKRQEEELRQRLEKEWRETADRERKARTGRVRLKTERDRKEREALAHEIKGAIEDLLLPSSPLDAMRTQLSFARVLGLAAEHFGYFLDWANLNPDIDPACWKYYRDRRPIPPPFDLLRPFLVSTNAPPYPYDVLDQDVELFMLDESLGQVRTIDWSDWSDDEFERGTLRAHFLLPMHGHKRNAWNQPRRIILTGNTFLSSEERIKEELDEKKTREERNLEWQMYMRTPLDNDDELETEN